ncbi:MAG: PPOX class F420-dependent oxidoreductase [Anaerolineales bacterium]|nr:PPOX class F420-dependent oxidoreductase [Anaerolineales bacterium]
MKIPPEYTDLLEKRAYAYLATLMPDGSPQITPVWVDFDGEYLRVNSAVGRQKDRNIRRDSRVALVIQDPDSPYRYLQIRGRVVMITEEGANEHIDSLARKYTGANYADRQPEQVRVIYKIDAREA